MNAGSCQTCGASLAGKRADAKWCSPACRMKASRHEARLLAYRSSYPAADVHAAESRASDERFHALISESRADEAARVARESLEREWSEFEGRNPGVAHPARTADRAQRQAAEREANAPKFTMPTVGERGRASRRAQIRATGPTKWDDNDPDMMEPPTMTDGPFRSRRRY
jgi:hypothetical protein